MERLWRSVGSVGWAARVAVSGDNVGGIVILNSNTLGVKRTKRFSCSNSRTLGTLGRRKVDAMLLGPGVTAVRASRKMTSGICFLPVAPCFIRRIVGGRRPSNVLLTFNKRATLGYKARLCADKALTGCNMGMLKASIRTVVCARSHSLFMGGLSRVTMGAPIDRTIKGLRSTIGTTCRVNFPIVVHSTCTLNNVNDNVYGSRTRLHALTRDTFTCSPRILIRRSLGN